MDDFNEDLEPGLIEEIGAWSERKHSIIQDYSTAFTHIMSNAQRQISRFTWTYIDGYAAAGLCRRRGTDEIVRGSALNSLTIEPSFNDFVFVELDDRKHKFLQRQTAKYQSVRCINDDANVVLPRDIVPEIDFRKYRRAFCLLDPYQHKHLNWSTIEAIGKAGTIDLLLHFPTMPMNRGALRRDGDVPPDEASAMDRFWGSSDWREAAYVRPYGLFEGLTPEKATDIQFAEAFCKRLKEVAGFHGTTRPIPMLNSAKAVLYYLIFAVPIETALRAAQGVAKYYIQNPQAISHSRGWEQDAG